MFWWLLLYGFLCQWGVLSSAHASRRLAWEDPTRRLLWGLNLAVWIGGAWWLSQ